MNNGRIASRRGQRGITLIGFVIVAAVVGFFVFVAIKIFPMYSEYYSVKSALKGLASEPGVARMEPARIQELFTRRLYVSYAENVKREHIKLQRQGTGWRMDVTYEVRKPLIANLDVVGKFSASQDLMRSGTD